MAVGAPNYNYSLPFKEEHECIHVTLCTRLSRWERTSGAVWNSFQSQTRTDSSPGFSAESFCPIYPSQLESDVLPTNPTLVRVTIRESVSQSTFGRVNQYNTKSEKERQNRDGSNSSQVQVSSQYSPVGAVSARIQSRVAKCLSTTAKLAWPAERWHMATLLERVIRFKPDLWIISCWFFFRTRKQKVQWKSGEKHCWVPLNSHGRRTVLHERKKANVAPVAWIWQRCFWRACEPLVLLEPHSSYSKKEKKTYSARTRLRKFRSKIHLRHREDALAALPRVRFSYHTSFRCSPLSSYPSQRLRGRSAVEQPHREGRESSGGRALPQVLEGGRPGWRRPRRVREAS